MKKLFAVMIIVTGLMACGGKKAAPKSGGDTAGSSVGSAEPTEGSASEAGSAQQSDGHDHQH